MFRVFTRNSKFEESQMGNERNKKTDEIKIDYDNIDVENIMEQIKQKIASQPPEAEPELPAPLPHASSRISPPPPQEGPPSKKDKIKKVLLKMFKPVSPLIKFLVLPVHQELKDTIKNVYRTNKRIDFLETRIDGDFNSVRQKLDEVDRATINRLEELNRIREYTQLLHNLSHNIVVEMTKLKIEQDNLKLKTRILEKDFEFLGKREKTLEHKVFG
jgi:hypothetical protein